MVAGMGRAGLISRRNGQLVNEALNSKYVLIRILSYLSGRSLWLLELIMSLIRFVDKLQNFARSW